MNNGHHEHETNPWIVTKIQDFLYFCCPECDVREPINSKEDFFKHAIENHPKSKYYLEELIKNEPDNLELGGDENNWHFDEYHTSDFLEGDNKPITEDFYVEENGNEIITTAGDCAKVKGEEIQNNSSNFEIDNIEISNNDFNNDETTCDDLLLNNVKCELKEDEFIENIIAEHQNVISEEKLSNYYKYKKQKECELCHKVFSDGACLRRHIRTVHEGQKYNCELCEKSFSQLPNLKIHINTVHDEDGTSTNKWREKYEKNRTPQECNNKDSTVLRRHIKAVHEKFETQGKMVHEDNEAYLNDHVTAYHDKPKDFFKCEFCDDKFQKLSVLKIHCIEIHDKQKFLKCDKCGKEFSQSQSLKEHVLFVHEGIKNHVCDSCGKAFGTSSVLKHHQKVVHEGQKHHVCKFCKKAFGESNDLRRHIEWVHEGKKDHICDSCGKAFGKLSSLKRHFQSIHEGIKYPCRLCKKTLGSPRDVKIHIQTVHEGVRKFKCNFCEKSFGRSEHLKRHTDTNHKQFTNQDQD